MSVKHANEQLVQYVKTQLESGYDLNAIEQVLLKSGYKQEDVDAAIDAALMDDSTSSAKSSSPKSKKTFLIIGAVILVALIAGGIAFISMTKNSQPPVKEESPPAEEPPLQEETVEPPADSVSEDVNDSTPVNESIAENETVADNETGTAEEEEIVPDQWIGPPLKDPDRENIVLMPGNSAYEFKVGESAAITVKVFRTDYIASLRPKIACEYIAQESFVTYEYEGNASVEDIAEVTFVFKGEARPVFSECHFKLSATDAHLIDSLFYITVKEADK